MLIGPQGREALTNPAPSQLRPSRSHPSPITAALAASSSVSIANRNSILGYPAGVLGNSFGLLGNSTSVLGNPAGVLGNSVLGNSAGNSAGAPVNLSATSDGIATSFHSLINSAVLETGSSPPTGLLEEKSPPVKVRGKGSRRDKEGRQSPAGVKKEDSPPAPAAEKPQRAQSAAQKGKNVARFIVDISEFLFFYIYNARDILLN